MPATMTILRWSPLPTGAPDTGAPETGAPDTGAFAGVSPVASAGAGSAAVGSVAVGSVAVGSVAVGSVASVVEMSVGSGAVVVGSVSAGFAVVALRVRRVVVAMVYYLHREWCGIRIRKRAMRFPFPVRRGCCLRPHVHGRSAPAGCQHPFPRLFVTYFSNGQGGPRCATGGAYCWACRPLCRSLTGD